MSLCALNKSMNEYFTWFISSWFYHNHCGVKTTHCSLCKQTLQQMDFTHHFLNKQWSLLLPISRHFFRYLCALRRRKKSNEFRFQNQLKYQNRKQIAKSRHNFVCFCINKVNDTWWCLYMLIFRPLKLTCVNLNTCMDNIPHAQYSVGWIYLSIPKLHRPVEVRKWVSYFIPHILMDVITSPCWDYS